MNRNARTLSRSRFTRTARLTAPALAVTLLAAACSSGSAATTGSESASGSASATAGGTTTGGASGCSSPKTLRVTVAPELAAVIEPIAKKVGAENCTDYKVTGQAPGLTAKAIAEKAPDEPALWIPDSPMYAQQVNMARPGAVVPSGSAIATSPVAFAVPKALAKAGSGEKPWLDIVANNFSTLRVAKPETSTASTLMLLAAWSGVATSTQGQAALSKFVIPLSKTASTDAALTVAAQSGQGAGIFPFSEQAIATFNKANPNTPMSALLPKEGLAELNYAPVTVGDAADTEAAPVKALLDALRGADGVQALSAAGFRAGADGAGPQVPGIPAKPKVVINTPTPGMVQLTMGSWDALSKDMRVLTVVDVSGSMKAKTPQGITRIQAAIQAAGQGVDQTPPTTQAGLWAFGEKKGGPNQDWVQLSAIDAMNATNGTITHAQALMAAFQKLPSLAGGGTGLYDTIWAAHQHMTATYDESKNNVVILLTDGKNDDPQSIGMAGLLSRLKAADPKKPVKLVLIGIGPADMAALKQIADTAGGSTLNADSGASVQDVLVDALLPVRPSSLLPK